MTNHETWDIEEDAVQTIDWGKRKALSKEAIRKITDVTFLCLRLDEAVDICVAIETQLEFSRRDDQWRDAAMTALIYNRIERKNLKARLDELKRAEKLRPELQPASGHGPFSGEP